MTFLMMTSSRLLLPLILQRTLVNQQKLVELFVPQQRHQYLVDVGETVAPVTLVATTAAVTVAEAAPLVVMTAVENSVVPNVRAHVQMFVLKGAHLHVKTHVITHAKAHVKVVLVLVTTLVKVVVQEHVLGDVAEHALRVVQLRVVDALVSVRVVPVLVLAVLQHVLDVRHAHSVVPQGAMRHVVVSAFMNVAKAARLDAIPLVTAHVKRLAHKHVMVHALMSVLVLQSTELRPRVSDVLARAMVWQVR